MTNNLPCALTVAGSDPCGGAGIQADIKTFAALKVHGQSVITSLTAQNTLGVRSIYNLPTGFIEEQFDAVMDDMVRCDAVKIGMLSNVDVVRSVSRKLEQYEISKVVLDPVMVSASGCKLLDDDAVSELIDMLMPQCCVVTPNVPEAEVMTGMMINNLTSMKKASEYIKGFGCSSVFLKGGHIDDPEFSTDIFFDGNEFREYKTKRLKFNNVHGTGCTVSSAICAYLAKSYELKDTIVCAKNYIFQAIKNGSLTANGNVLLNHSWNMG